jgi:hypothetical protein
MEKLIKKQLKHVEKQESKLMKNRGDSWLSLKTQPARGRIESTIPEQVKSGLETAFYKGFKLVFEKGQPLISKTYNKDKSLLRHEALNEILDGTPNRKNLRKVNLRATRAHNANLLISAVEGSALGLLGIGVPDIPIFIGMILRTLHETALSYGIDSDPEDERLYALLLICAALTRDEKRRMFNHQILLLEKRLQKGELPRMDLDEQIRVTAGVLSDTLLTAKFIQGLPIVGVIGGAVNYSVIRSVGNFARLKYKKRYLMGKSE